jgi:hypothetical protein
MWSSDAPGRDVPHAPDRTQGTLALARDAHMLTRMSRAFVNEDAGGGPRRDYHLPERDDPEFEAIAAKVLLEAARAGETAPAEDATGFRWGDPLLAPHVRRLMSEAEREGDERLAQLARRFLR